MIDRKAARDPPPGVECARAYSQCVSDALAGERRLDKLHGWPSRAGLAE